MPLAGALGVKAVGALLGPIGPAHLPGVLAIQARAYGATLLEDAEVLGSKLSAPGDTSWGAFAQIEGCGVSAGAPTFVRAKQRDDLGKTALHSAGSADSYAVSSTRLCAYAIAHAVPPGAALALNKPLERASSAHDLAPGDWLYVHDIAIDPDWAGGGLAAQLLDAVLASGRRLGLSRAMLVAVQDADAYWARHGFVAQTPPMPVVGFGEGAVWMVRNLA